MAKKPTLSTIASGYASNTTLNSNFEELRDAFDNTLSLDGSTPNAMGADLDLNGNNIIGAAGLTVNGTDYLVAVTAAKEAALVAQAAAETAETNAETAETNAGSSQTAAASSASAASSSATAAQTAKTAAELAETNAETAAALATTNGAAQVALATTQATNAATSATTATTQASTATTQAGIATTKASEASASASAAAASAASITDEEANAAASASAAASSATASANSAAASAAALDTFDDRYLGSKTANPTLDNDGDALVAGALYFNSTANEMRVYDGANWIAASSSGVASMNLYEYTATSGQTTFTGSDDNSNSISFIAGNEIVVLNGVILDPSDYNSSSGTSIVLASGAATGDLLNVYAFKSFTVADTVSASAGGTFAGNITVTGSFTSQGIDDNANATAITIDASENVGIGTSSPSPNKIAVNGDQVLLSNGALKFADAGNSHVGLIKNSGTSGTGQLEFYTGPTTTEAMRIDSSGQLIIKTAGGALQWNNGYQTITGDAVANDLTYRTYQNHIFKNTTGSSSTTDGTEVMRIDSSGALLHGTTTAGSAGAGDIVVNGGVYLGGTGSANKLDDYETGTFNPHLYDDHDDSLKISFTGQGDYIKVGNVLSFSAQCYGNGIASTTFTGQPYIQLPFTIVRSNATIAYLGYFNGIGNAQQMFALGAGTNQLRFATTLTNPYNTQVSTGETWGGNIRIYFSGTIIVDT